jgi:hypothetical protein
VDRKQMTEVREQLLEKLKQLLGEGNIVLK